MMRCYRLIHHGEMRHPEPFRLPGGNRLPFRLARQQGMREKSQLETETSAISSGKIAREIPPFIAVPGVQAMIFRKAEAALPLGAQETRIGLATENGLQ